MWQEIIAGENHVARFLRFSSYAYVCTLPGVWESSGETSTAGPLVDFTREIIAGEIHGPAAARDWIRSERAYIEIYFGATECASFAKCAEPAR